MSTIEELYRQRQNKFIESRTVIESEVNQFLRSIEQLDVVFQTELCVIEGQTARDVLPALWEEPFDNERYLTQRALLDERITKATQLRDKLNAEAMQCLQG